MNAGKSVGTPVRPGRVTLARVAGEAGVSIATASKVANGREGVGEATRHHVQAIVERLGYVGVGERTRPVRGEREPLIEIIVSSLRSPYILTVLSGAASAAESAEAAVVVRTVDSVRHQDPMSWAQRLARCERIGVVEVTSEFSVERERALHTVGLPVVLVDSIHVPRTSIFSVGATNWSGGMDATRHLLELGHTEIAYIGGPEGAGCDVARLHGFHAAVQQFGGKVNSRHATHGPFTFDQGLAAGLTVLDRADRPTAIFAGSDMTAMGVLEAARKLHIRVPDDLSVVGFDNTMIAQSSAPRLTTVHQPVQEIGRTAVETVIRLARGETLATQRVELATHLVIRDSTAPPRSPLN